LLLGKHKCVIYVVRQHMSVYRSFSKTSSNFMYFYNFKIRSTATPVLLGTCFYCV